MHPNDTLIAESVPMIERLVERYCSRRGLDNVDDLMGPAMEALVVEGRKWDKNRGKTWRSFIHQRVTWALLQTGRDAHNDMSHLVYLNDVVGLGHDEGDPDDEQDGASLQDAASFLVDEDEPDPMDLAAVAEDVNWLWDCMATLPDEQRRALELLYVQGYTYPEAAAEMELSEAAVRRRMSAGLRSLRLAADGR